MADKKPSMRAIGLMVAVFVLGGLVGGLGAVVVRRMHQSSRRERMIDRLSRQLDLSSEQRGQVQGIFADAHKQFVAVFDKAQDQARPQYDAIRKNVHARIRAILTAAQQVKFDEFLTRLDAEHRIHPPPPPRRGRRRR